MKKLMSAVTILLLLISVFAFLTTETKAEGTIFSEGFESGDFSDWTASYSSHGSIWVESGSPHHGSYAARFYTDGADNAIARIRKDFASAYMEVYVRAYVKFDTLPAEYLWFMSLRDSGQWTMAGVRIRNVQGTNVVSALKHKDGQETWVNSQSSLGIVSNKWISVELHFKVSDTDGQINVYINDNEISDLTDTMFNSLGMIDHLNVGSLVIGAIDALSGGVAMNSYIDCIEVSTSRVGLEITPGATIEIEENALNLKSRNTLIAAYIEPPPGYAATEVDESPIKLNNTVLADTYIPIVIGAHGSDTIFDFIVELNRTAISQFILSMGITHGSVTLEITGPLIRGTLLKGSFTIQVRMPGDINIDGRVDVRDLALAGNAFGSYLGHQGWSSIADENEDNKVDIRDLVSIASNFGQIYP